MGFRQEFKYILIPFWFLTFHFIFIVLMTEVCAGFFTLNFTKKIVRIAKKQKTTIAKLVSLLYTIHFNRFFMEVHFPQIFWGLFFFIFFIEITILLSFLIFQIHFHVFMLFLFFLTVIRKKEKGELLSFPFYSLFYTKFFIEISQLLIKISPKND